MLIAQKFSGRLSNEEMALQLFPKIMDNSCGPFQAPRNHNSGWCQYVRPNGDIIFREWGPKRWLLCNPEYDYDRI